VVLVDLDGEMTRIAKDLPMLREQNGGSFSSERVQVVNDDAYLWLESDHGKFDAAIIDFPDPNNFALGKLYTTRFYKLLRRSLAPGAPVVVQSTSPLMARQSFWCVAQTMEAAGLKTHAYHVAVPSFGEWGFVLAMDHDFEPPAKLVPVQLSYLTEAFLPSMFIFPADMDRVPAEVNRLDNQVLVQYYDQEWKRWN
jgi:spermidine synthase